jgi:putative transposase
MPSLPNENAIRRLVGAILMEQTEEWAVQRARYNNPLVSLPAAQVG